jgi:hypothetical protein
VNETVATAAGTTVTGVAAGVTDCVFANGTAADTARVAVVAQAGFAAAVTPDVSVYRASCTAGSQIQLPFQFVRPAAGDGDLGSVQGSVSWDPSVLTYVSSGTAASGWSWFPNESNTGSGTLGYAAFSPVGTAATFPLVTLTFDCAGTAGDVTAVTPAVTAAGDGVGNDITEFVAPVVSRVTVQ